jgi:hypothetical protein
MNDTPPEPAAAGAVYTTIQPSGPYKASSIKEGFICAGIWAALSIVLIVPLTLWGEHAHPERGVRSAEEWAHFIGATVGQSVLMAIFLSSVAFYRRRKNVTSFILLDWRWWLVCVVFGVLPNKPVLAWLWVGLIYQVRLKMKPKFPQSPATQVSGE